MRIGIFLPNPKEWFGGVNYYLRLCAVLDRYGGKNICCVVFHSDELPNSVLVRFSSMLNIKLIKTANIKQTKIRLVKSLVFGRDNDVYSLICEHKLDFVVENGAYFGWRLSKSIICWVPDLQHVFLKSNFKFFARCKRDVGFFLQRLTRRKIYLSSFDAMNSFSERYFCSVKKLNVVRFSVDNSEFENIDEDVACSVLKKYRLNENIIYFPSQVWTHKNHCLLIKAIAKLNEMCQELSFQVVSTGDTFDYRNPDYFNELLELKRQLSVSDEKFVFLGQVPFEDVQALMKISSAVINPSLFEGWSTTVEEARSIGKTLILSDIPIHKEQAPENTLFFESDNVDSLVEILIRFINDYNFTSINCDKTIDDDNEFCQRRFFADFINLVNY